MCKGATMDGFDTAVTSVSVNEFVPSKLPTFSRAEIAEKRHDLVIIEDKVYSAARFRWAHPGGAVFVSLFGGRDGTLAFQSYHMREFPHERMAPYLEGALAASETVTRPCAEHAELSKLVKPLLGASRGFAPTSQLAKAALLFACSVAVEVRMLLVGRSWLGSAVLGLFFAWIGLNIQHDANHGAMFKNGGWNAVCGLAQHWIGGSQLMWLQEHVVLHHVHTGDVSMDPDAQLAPVMRGHAKAVWYPWMQMQKFYFVLIELGYGVVPLFMAFGETFAWKHKFEAKFALSRLAWLWGVQSVLCHCAFYARLVVLPGVMAASAARAQGAGVASAVAVELAKVAVTVLVGGGYLAFFFFLSHNFDGVQFVEGAEHTGAAQYPEQSSFLRQQVASSSNVGGAKLCFVNGGLNYQIEHHLFPRIAHSHYPTIAPLVRKFVESKGASYAHFDSVSENLKSVFTYLGKTGQRDYARDVPKPKAA